MAERRSADNENIEKINEEENMMKMKGYIMMAAGMLSLAASAQTITLEECRQRALDHNKSLSAAKVQYSKSVYDMKSYRANYFPQISLLALDYYSWADGDFTLQGGKLPIYKYVESLGSYVPSVSVAEDGSYRLDEYADFPSQKIGWKVKNIFMGGVSLLEPLYAGGKITAAHRMSQIGEDVAASNVRLTESEVVVNTEEAYFLAVEAKEMGQVARSYKAALDEVRKNVEAAFRHGMSTRNDMMKVQVKLNEAELSVQKADNASRLARMNLCHLTGMPLDSMVEVVVPGMDAEALLNDCDSYVLGLGDRESMGVEARPEYQMVSQKSELARLQVKMAKSDMLPTVSLNAAYIYMNGGELGGEKLTDKGSASVGLVVNMPLDFFGAKSNKVRSAKAAYQMAQLEQQDICEKMTLEQRQCWNAYDEAKTELRLCASAFSQAEENVRLSRQQYEVGFETLSDHLEAQALRQQCGADLAKARCQLLLQRSKLAKALGRSVR